MHHLAAENSSSCRGRGDAVSSVQQAFSCRRPLDVLKDTKISNSVDTKLQVYSDSSLGMPGQQGAAPTSTLALPVEQVRMCSRCLELWESSVDALVICDNKAYQVLYPT